MAVEKQEAVMDLTDVEARTILRCEVGSEVHGLSIASSDRDELGVCLEPAEFVIGLKHFEQHVHRTKPQGVRSAAGDLDLTVYGLRKFASLALKGNPSILLLFNVPEEKCMVLTDLGRELRELAWAFASRKAGAAFLGYMQQQRQRLAGERGQMNVKRTELVEAHGYNTKYAGHIARLGFQGIDYMRTGSFPIPMPGEQIDYILGVRNGNVLENDFLTFAGELEEELKAEIDGTMLPNQPDYQTVNTFLVAAYTRLWASWE